MATLKPRILSDDTLEALAREFGTPLYVYDAAVIRERLAELRGFDVVRYAQKANSNLAVLDLLRRGGAQVDAVSAGEIARALAAGFEPREIVFTADLFERDALAAIERHAIPVNVGSEDMLAAYARMSSVARAPAHHARRAVTLRVNPGFGHGHHARVTTGGESSKHGVWHADLPRAVARARELGLDVVGLHVHIGSGSDFDHLARVCESMRAFVQMARESIATVSAGGGLPVPYRTGEARMDVARFTSTWRESKAAMEAELDRPITLEVEPGRYLVAEAGLVLTEVRGTKRNGNVDYAIVDAGFHTLVRPALYGAFHQISAVGRADGEHTLPTVVAGPLCESADVFTQDRDGTLRPALLPPLAAGDLLCIHDAGAYAASMASNYNSHPAAAEVLVTGGRAHLVRSRQSIADLFSRERIDERS